MRSILLASLSVLALAAAVPDAANAAAILLPGGALDVSAAGSGSSFTYSGILTSADTLGFTETGVPCLQALGSYCTNGAGVVVVAGNGAGMGQSSANPDNGTAFGSLLLTIFGVGTAQLFATNAANGLGSASPPVLLTLASTSLGALGFGSFSTANPVLTFSLSDYDRGDNTGAFTLGQAATVPEPATLALLAMPVLLAGLVTARRNKPI